MKPLLFFFAALCSISAYAQTPKPNVPPKFQSATVNIPLAWDASPSTGVVAYVVRRGDVSGTYLEMVEVPGHQTNYTWPNADAFKSCFFVATAKNAAGLESQNSNEVEWKPASGRLEPPAKLNPPTAVTAKFKVTPPVTFEQVSNENEVRSKFRLFIDQGDGSQNVMLTTTDGGFRIAEGPKLGKPE